MLENMGIMSSEDGMLNPARAAVLFAGDRNGKPMEDLGGLTAICADRRKFFDISMFYILDIVRSYSKLFSR